MSRPAILAGTALAAVLLTAREILPPSRDRSADAERVRRWVKEHPEFRLTSYQEEDERAG